LGEDSPGTPLDITAGSDINFYRSPEMLGPSFQSKEPELGDGTGDLIVTTSTIYFLSQGQTRRIPCRKIVAVHSFSDAIRISRGGIEKKIRTFVLDDSWFGINLIALVVRGHLAKVSSNRGDSGGSREPLS
jgi:hypothetical protein